MVILHCVITQAAIDRDLHQCENCPAAEAITDALTAAGLERLLPVTVIPEWVRVRDDRKVLFVGPDRFAVATPRSLDRWIRSYDEEYMGRLDGEEPGRAWPIEFDLDLPEDLIEAAS